MLYHNTSCDLYICGVGSDIYRLNLEQGQFLSPLESSLSSGINVIYRNIICIDVLI